MSITRVAIAGTRGHYAATLAEIAAIPELRVTALHAASDPIDPLTTWCARHGHQPQVFDDYEAMLDQARPDLVVVCGPFESHAPMCVAAISRGVHVLTEKPAALTFAQLGQLRAACDASPHVLLAAMMFSRYSPGFAAARRLIDDGALGDLRLIDTRKSYKLGTRPTYYHRRETYGGTIPWVGSHAIDWILHLAAGRHTVRSVHARHSSAHNGGNGTMETSATCHFEMDNDLLATVSIDYLRPAAAPTHGDDWARIVGNKATMEVRPDSVILITTTGPQQVDLRADRTLFSDITHYIRDKQTPLITTQSTLTLTDACLRALHSADEKRVIAFDGPPSP